MKSKLSIFLMTTIAMIALLIAGCKKDAVVVGKQLPVLVTGSVTDITKTTAKASAKIYELGNPGFTEKGFVWDTAQSATLEKNLGKVSVAGMDTTFSGNLSNLKPGTKYFVRAYATNSVGTAYGFPVGFLTVAEPISLTDADGNVYQTVTIGAQVWMAENLRTTKYNDGTPIPNVSLAADWNALTTGAYSDYNNDPANATDYGRIYNWYAINTGKLAPAGWHVPTAAEWATLVTTLGGEGTAGGPAKETGTAHWNAPNTGATNTSGFSARGGGYRHPAVGAPGFAALKDVAIFQSASEHVTNPGAWNYYVILEAGKTSFVNIDKYWVKQAGASIRLIKD
jgi:uncharacterized protein (TIGR02145 family)